MFSIRSKHIQPTCLPSPCATFDAGDLCVAGGYGKDAFGDEGRWSGCRICMSIYIYGKDAFSDEGRWFGFCICIWICSDFVHIYWESKREYLDWFGKRIPLTKWFCGREPLRSLSWMKWVRWLHLCQLSKTSDRITSNIFMRTGMQQSRRRWWCLW